MFTITLGHLLERGVCFQRYEALAIAQELIARGEGVPTANNVQLSSDGSVTCINTDGTPAVADVAGLLQALLPTKPGQVPAPLRYTLARGSGAVEAPPFESLDAFSQSLARFEAGDRRAIIRSLLQRVAASTSAPDVPAASVMAPVAVAARAPEAVVVDAPGSAVNSALVAVVKSGPEAVTNPPVGVKSPPVAVVKPAPVAVAKSVPVAVAASAPAAVVAFPPKAPPPAAVVARPVEPVLAPTPASRVRAESPSRARSARAPLNWRVALLAVAASFALGALGGAWAGLWPATSGARPAAAQPSAARSSAETVAPRSRSRAGERPVSTTGSAPAAPFTDVALAPAQPTDEPAPREDMAAAPAPIGEPVPMIRGEAEAVFSPAFVNTGSAMFFHTGGAGDPSSAIAMTPDAAARPNGDLRIIKVLDDGARNYHPRPSPDGRLIAFDSDRDGERGIYVANGDGTQVRRVSGDGYAAAPTWSPDGKRLTYIRAEAANPRVWNLWVQPLGGERATRVTGHQVGQTWSASWFPDNKRICYTHEDKIIVRDLATGESRQFASPVAGRIVRTPAVSPDGTKVVFQVFRNGGWLLDLADGSMRRVLSDPTAEEFAWAPDGSRIAFHSRRTGEWSIYVVAPG